MLPSGLSPTPAVEVPEDLDALEDALTELAAHLNAAEYRFLVLLERFDRSEGHLGPGLKSTAHWLNWKCGIALGAARERVRVARALPGLPKISAAFAAGELSFSKVRAMTRVATADNEDILLRVAKGGTASHLERVIRGYRRAECAKEIEEANVQHAARELVCWYDDDGSLIIRGRLPPEQGALFLKALEAAGDALREEARAMAETAPEGTTEPPSYHTTQADALVRIAETALAHEPTAISGGERYQVIVHVDHDTLPADGPGMRSHLEDGPSVSAETSRRLSCDCSVVRVHENADGEILNIGRKSRQIPPAIRRALHIRDHGCRFPGCTQHRYVDGHHVVHWADGGETSLDNLVLLCRYHHRLVHEGGFSVAREGKAFRFRDPTGVVLPEAPLRSLPEDGGEHTLRRANAEQGLDITPRTAVPGWAGERLDLPWTIQALQCRAGAAGVGPRDTDLFASS
jgi:hypothetical protein